MVSLLWVYKMKQIKVELLDSHGSDAAIANAARCSFGDFENWNSIPEGYSQERMEKLINYLASHRHMTPFRHNSLSIRCTVPIFLARQLMKHQVGLTWNEESRRYITKEVEFFTPEEWRAKPEGSVKQGSGGTINRMVVSPLSGEKESIEEIFEDFSNFATEIYQLFLDEGVAPEMARMVLPQSMLTTFVWTGNLLAFAHVVNERSYSGAQLEAQYFAKQLKQILSTLFPISTKALINDSE